MNIKRVIVLTIDSLKFDRLGIAGYPLSLSPTIDYLARTGIHCTQAIAPSSATQISHPTIWSSTLPLDYGGYDRGVKYRPVTLAEVFQQHGFKTAAFSSGFWFSDYYGYDRGFDEFVTLYDVREIWLAFYINHFMYYLSRWRNGHISLDELCTRMAPVLEDAFVSIVEFCTQSQTALPSAPYSYRGLMHRDELLAVSEAASVHLKGLRADPSDYVWKHADQLKESDLMRFLRVPMGSRERLARGLLRRTPSALGLSFFTRMFMQKNNLIPRRVVDGSFIIDQAQKWLGSDRSEKQFLWVPLDDAHDDFFFQLSLSSATKWQKLRDERRKLDGSYQGGFHYDLAINYVDSQIARLLNGLRRRGELANTLIAICADHGKRWAEVKNKPHQNHVREVDFFEEYVRVPMIFWHPDIHPQTIEHLCGLIDFAPTITDLMGFSPVAGFTGLSVLSEEAAKRSHLLMEDVVPGPCDIAEKGVRIGVRTESHKYIWQEPIHDDGERSELYDLVNDPEERRNVKGLKPYEDVSSRLQSYVVKRVGDLKQNADLGVLANAVHMAA